MEKGKVKWFNSDKGMDLFNHHQVIQMYSYILAKQKKLVLELYPKIKPLVTKQRITTAKNQQLNYRYFNQFIQMIIDYIDDNDVLVKKAKAKKYTKPLKDDGEDIKLANSIINQERVVAIKAYRELVAQRKSKTTNTDYTTELFYL